VFGFGLWVTHSVFQFFNGPGYYGPYYGAPYYGYGYGGYYGYGARIGATDTTMVTTAAGITVDRYYRGGYGGPGTTAEVTMVDGTTVIGTN